MNQIIIEGSITQIQDYKRLIYKLREDPSGLIWIVDSSKELKLGWIVKVSGSVTPNVIYQDRDDILVEATRNLIVVTDKVEILDVTSEIETSNEIVW